MIRDLKNTHLGERCFILGSGPSINKQDLHLLQDEFTFCSNWFINHKDINELNINYYCAYDDAFIVEGINKTWQDKLKNLSAHKFFPQEWSSLNIDKNASYVPYDKHNKVYKNDLFNTNLEKPLLDAGTVIINMCIPIAVYMGFKEIILLGVETDYRLSSDPSKKKAYFYSIDKQHTKNKHDVNSQDIWIQNVLKSYDIVQSSLNSTINIRNATIGGNLKSFDRIQYEQLFGEKNDN